MSDKATESEELITFKCPRCSDGKILLKQSVYDLPDEEKMLILKFECDKCDYTNNDIIPIETKREPGIMTLTVNSEEDLKSKVYRSPTGKLEIPELELVVDPGPAAKFYYTNIEGILMRFEGAVSIYRKNLDEDDSQKDEIDGILMDLKAAMKGNLQFTLRVMDPVGGSYILPINKSNLTFEELDDEEMNT